MKVGDLVYCPVDLTTGEMFCKTKTLAIITALREHEPRVEVVYCAETIDPVMNVVCGMWFTEEVEEIED